MRIIRRAIPILLLLLLTLIPAAAQDTWTAAETIGRGRIDAAVWLPDDRLAVAGARGLWVYADVAAEPELIAAPYGWMRSAALANYALVTGHQDGSVTVWDALDLTERTHFSAQDGPIRAISLSADGTRAALLGSSVQVWDLTTQTVLLDLSPPEIVDDVAISPDGGTLYVLNRLSFAQTNDLGNRSQLDIIPVAAPGDTRRLENVGSDTVEDIAVSPDGRFVALPGTQGLFIYDTEAGTLEPAPVPVFDVRFVAFRERGLAFVSDTRFSTVFWDDDGSGAAGVASLTEVDWIDFTEPLRFSAFAYSEIGVALIGSRGDGTILRMWGPGSPGIVDVPYDGPVVDVTFAGGEIVPHYSLSRSVASPDGAFTARWRSREGMVLTDAAGTESFLPLDPVSLDSSTTADSIAFSPDSRWLAAVIIPDQRAIFWDATTGEQVQTFRTGRIFDVAVSDTHAAISTPDGFRVWPVDDWDSATRLDAPEPFGEQANVRVLLGSTQVIGWDNPYPLQTGGECIGCGSSTYGFILYAADIAGGDVRSLMETDAYTALDVALSPDESFVAVGADDGQVHLIDLATGDEIAAFGGGQGAVNAVQFDAAGRLAAGYASGIVQVWED